jgi:hypothetical protein
MFGGTRFIYQRNRSSGLPCLLMLWRAANEYSISSPLCAGCSLRVVGISAQTSPHLKTDEKSEVLSDGGAFQLVLSMFNFVPDWTMLGKPSLGGLGKVCPSFARNQSG